jgi:hypothetical protein
MLRSIPSEICDAIIDCQQFEHATLAILSLVHTSWLPRARFHLFTSVSLRNDSHAAAFFGLLDSPLSTLPICVQHLHLSGGRIINMVVLNLEACIGISRLQRLASLTFYWLRLPSIQSLVTDSSTPNSNILSQGAQTCTPRRRSPQPRSLHIPNIDALDRTGACPLSCWNIPRTR